MWVNVIVHFLFEYIIRILFRIKRKIQKKQKIYCGTNIQTTIDVLKCDT